MATSTMDFEKQLLELKARLDGYRHRGLRTFATSSFQSNSLALLHMLSEVGRDVPVYFLNTGYHFPETLAFRDDLARRFGLAVITLASPVPRLQQRDDRGRLLFASDPDRCCDMNKVEPLEAVLMSKDVWVSGVRASQSPSRRAMRLEEPTRHGVLRYHPLIDWTSSMVQEYIEAHQLPEHPLEALGYHSVGCQPCTRRPSIPSPLDDRSGRWLGLRKTECGLHLDVRRSR